MTFLHWHRTAAKAQFLARSAFDALRDPAHRAKATQAAQAMFDCLASLGFKRSGSDHKSEGGHSRSTPD